MTDAIGGAVVRGSWHRRALRSDESRCSGRRGACDARPAGRGEEEQALRAALAAAAAQLAALGEAAQDEMAAPDPRVSAGPARGRGLDRANPRGRARRAAGGYGMGQRPGPRDRRLPGDRRRHLSGTRGRSRRSARSGRAARWRRPPTCPSASGGQAAIYRRRGADALALPGDRLDALRRRRDQRRQRCRPRRPAGARPRHAADRRARGRLQGAAGRRACRARRREGPSHPRPEPGYAGRGSKTPSAAAAKAQATPGSLPSRP